jgi:hypothetical protein
MAPSFRIESQGQDGVAREDTMNPNPYAPPQAPPVPSRAPLSAVGVGQPWTPSEVFRGAIAVFKTHWTVLISACAFRIALFVPYWALSYRIRHTHSLGTGALSSLALGGANLAELVIGEGFLATGVIRVCLAAARGRPTSMMSVFSGGDRFVPMASLALILYGLGPLARLTDNVRLATRVASGVEILGSCMGLWIAQWLVVDQKRGPFDALREAWRFARGQRGKVFLSVACAFLVCYGGLGLCGIGLFVSLPLSNLMFTIMYLHMTGATSLRQEARAGVGP